MEFDDFFELEIRKRRSKSFKTKKRLRELIGGEIRQQDVDEESEGTSIQNSKDNVEDILKRNNIESQDIPLEKIRFFFDFRMPSLVNCRKLLASITKNFDRKSGTLKVFGIKNDETGDTEYALLDGTHRYICYKYLQMKSVPADVLKDSTEEWEWFYIAGGGNVISSTHVPMDIYSKIKLIGEIMEKKVNGKVLTANEAKPIIQKNVPGFQDKCSKESINSYNRIYKSYKGKYLNMVQQVVMKKETKSHSMVKDNLELPSLMSLEDSPFKEELFRKMGESKMNKDEVITLINRNKFVKFVEDRLEDTEEEALKKNIIKAIESGKYDTWLVREDASIRDGQLEGTKLWGKIEKLLNQQNPTNSKREEDEYQGNEDEQLLVNNNNNKRKRQSDTKWESRPIKKRKTEQIHVTQSQDKSLDTERDVGNHYSTPASHLSNRRVAAIQGPVRFRPPRSFKLSISTDEEYQFTIIDGELYISLTCIPHDKYKQLEDAFRSKNPNNSVDPPVSQKSIIKDTINTNNNSISLFEEDNEGEVLLLHSSTNNDGDFLRHDTDTSEHHYGTSETPNNNNNNSRKSFSSVQSVGSYLFEDNDNGRKDATDQQELEDELQESIDSSHSSENKARKEKKEKEKRKEKEKKKEKEKSKKKRSGKKEKNKKDKKDTNRTERKSKKPVSESKEAQGNDVEQPTNSNDKEDRQEEEEKEKEHHLSKFNSEGNSAESEKKMEIDSYDEHHFDNDDDDFDSQSHQQANGQDNSSKKEEDKEEANINDQGSEDNDDDDDNDNQFGDDEDMEDADNNTNNRNDNAEADHSTLEKHVKRYYGKISRIFNGKDTTTRLKQWKSGIREFTRRTGGYSVADLKVILALLTEWSKHFNRVKPKFEEQAELNLFVVDVLWYELAYRLLSDKHGVSLKEAKAMLEKSSELVIN